MNDDRGACREGVDGLADAAGEQSGPIVFPVLSTDGRTTLAARVWLPPEGVETRLNVQLIHGMAEHIGRYGGFARYLASRGVAVVGHDHAGHGMSAVDGGDPSATWGVLEPHSGAMQLVNDVDVVYREAAPLLPEAPRAVFGHSMGSFVARVFAAKHGEGLCAAVFSGTGWQPRLVLRAGAAAASLVGRARGWGERSKAIDAMAVGSYGKGFGGEQYARIAWLSRDVGVRRAYDEDPACGFMFTAGAYHELFRLIAMSQDPRIVRSMPHDLPILMASGSDDPVGGAAAVKRVDGFLRRCGARDVATHVYEGARHEILNETNGDEVMADIASWLLGKGAGR